MADFTSKILALLLSSNQAAKEAAANQLWDAATPAMLYARNPATSTGLTWGFIGGRFANADIANGTVALTNNATNYVVANRTTGAVTASTGTTDWINNAFQRLYEVTTSGGVVTNWIDHRTMLPGTVGSGDVVGPASATDNALPRFDGTTGKLLQGSGVLVTDNNEISGYRGDLNAQTGTTYTLVAADTGKVVEITNASAITLTMPNNLPVGWCCTVVQGGAGQISFSPASGAFRRNRQGHTRTAGQWGMTTLYVRTNAGGTAAEYVLGGDTAA